MVLLFVVIIPSTLKNASKTGAKTDIFLTVKDWNMEDTVILLRDILSDLVLKKMCLKSWFLPKW